MVYKNKDKPLKFFIYCRKSSEPEDKQILSLPAQVSELTRYAKENKLTVVDIFQESRSAHTIGRSDFNSMLVRIEKGEANGLIVWDESRIARNSYDGGKVVYMMDLAEIVEIRKPGKTYRNTPDDKSWLQMCFMMSKKESDDKSANVKRGLKEKAKQGMYVGSAKPGYMFDPIAKQGEKDLIPIPGKYELIERAWKTMMTGKYRVAQILEMLNNEWGYRTPIRGKLGGKPMFTSELYEMFHDRFYMGEFEYPRGSDDWHRWRGISMIDEESFMRVQAHLGGKFLPRPQHREFAFTCLIRCVCGSAITAEEKWQTICTICHDKFSSLNRNSCPKCGTRVENMDDPTILHYIYYRCTRKVSPDCIQRSVRLEDLEPQIDEILRQSAISEEFKEWAVKFCNELNDEEVKDRNVVLEELQKNYDGCIQRLDNLVKLKISPQNTDSSLLSDEEFKDQKSSIIKEKQDLEARLGSTGKRIENWIENLENGLDFAVQARYRFATGTLAEKRDILATIGSNMILEGKKLRLDAQKPYCFLTEILKVEPTASAEFEPKKRANNTAQLESLWAQNPAMQGWRELNPQSSLWRRVVYR